MAEEHKDAQVVPESSSEGGNAARQLKRVQAVTGLIIGAFSALHLGNHAFMHFGLAAHTAVLKQVRKIYTAPVAERVLLLSMAVHVAVALVRARGLAKELPRKLFQLAGWFLVGVMPGHIYYTRVAGQKAGMKEFDITHAAMAVRIIPAFFLPYYMLMAAAGAYHTFAGFQKAGTILGIDQLKNIPSKGEKFKKWATILTLVSVSSALAVSGVYFRYPMVEEALLLKVYRKEWPKGLFKYVQMPKNGAWFGTLTVS